MRLPSPSKFVYSYCKFLSYVGMGLLVLLVFQQAMQQTQPASQYVPQFTQGE